MSHSYRLYCRGRKERVAGDGDEKPLPGVSFARQPDEEMEESLRLADEDPWRSLPAVKFHRIDASADVVKDTFEAVRKLGI
ncbi:MAG: hypothetical protein V2I67_12585 [Thermoanaerobaculales bacterium]|nr:hypothetical protein [Thermoanaerobaculales bacterium]